MSQQRSHSFSIGSEAESGLPFGQSPVYTVERIDFFKDKSNKDLEHWLATFELVATANKWSDSVKCVQLAGCLMETAKSWYDTLSLEVRTNWSLLLDALRTAFKLKGRRHNMLIHKQIAERKQGMGESVDAYGYALAYLFNKLDQKMAEETQMNFFIQGLLPHLSKKVFRVYPSSFREAVDAAKREEDFERQYKAVKSDYEDDSKRMVAREDMERLEMKIHLLSEGLRRGQGANLKTSHPNSNSVFQLSDRERESLSRRREENGLEDHGRFHNNSYGKSTRRDNGNRDVKWPPNAKRVPVKVYRTVEGYVICKGCLRVGHYEKECPE